MGEVRRERRRLRALHWLLVGPLPQGGNLLEDLPGRDFSDGVLASRRLLDSLKR